MARVTNPAFAGFDATAFRLAIRSAMTMAAPNATQDKATFRWAPVKTYAVQDPTHRPYSWTSTPATDVEHADVQVPVAVEFQAQRSATHQTALGEFDTTRVIITILDVDFALIETANQVILGGNTYDIQFVAPPIGLFEVDVFQIYATALDES